MKVKIAHIHTGERMRALNPERVDELKKSIAAIGLKTPISLRQRPSGELGKWGGWQLVAGLHRLEACRALGFEEIEAREEYGSETDARLWEIAENLHRAELTALERSEHIAEWIRLTEEKQAVISGQVAQKSNPANPKGAGRHEGGLSAAARELGIERTEARRAIRRAEGIAPEVAREIRAMPAIADSGVELDALARAEPQQQIAAVEAVKAGVAKNVREALTANRPTAEAAASCIDRAIEQAIEAIRAISPDQPATVEVALSRMDQASEALTANRPAIAEAAPLSYAEAIDIALELERYAAAMFDNDEIDIVTALKHYAAALLERDDIAISPRLKCAALKCVATAIGVGVRSRESIAKAARKFDLAPSAVVLATMIVKNGAAELISLVERGKITLAVGALVALLPPQEQRRLLADAIQSLNEKGRAANAALPETYHDAHA